MHAAARCPLLLLQLHGCINPRACYRSKDAVQAMSDWAYNHRQLDITQLNKATNPNGTPLLQEYMQYMCLPGYEGPLCGSCEEYPTPYGHSTHTCRPCPSPSFNNLWYFVVSVFMFVVPVLNMWLHSQNVRKRSAQIHRARIGSIQQQVAVQPLAGLVQQESLAPDTAAAGPAGSGAKAVELAALQQQQQLAAGGAADVYGVPQFDQDVAPAASQQKITVDSKPGIIPTLHVSTATTAMSYSSTASPTATINSASPFINEHAASSQPDPIQESGCPFAAAAAAVPPAQAVAGASSSSIGGRLHSASSRLFRHFFDHQLLDDSDVPRLLSTSTIHSPQSYASLNSQQQQQKLQHGVPRSVSMPVPSSISDGMPGRGAMGAGVGGVQQLQRRTFKFWHTDIIMVSTCSGEPAPCWPCDPCSIDLLSGCSTA
jgi:hypothetical protein